MEHNQYVKHAQAITRGSGGMLPQGKFWKWMLKGSHGVVCRSPSSSTDNNLKITIHDYDAVNFSQLFVNNGRLYLSDYQLA